MAEELMFDPVTVDINQQYEIFGDGLDNEETGFTPVDEIVAKNVLDEVKLDFPQDLQYDIFNEMKKGSWKGFDLMPAYKNDNFSKRAMTNDDIIQLFAVGPNGETFEPGSFESGFKRDILKQTGGFAGFVGGAKIGAKFAKPLPIPSIAKFGISTFTGLLGAITGDKSGEELTNLMLGPEGNILPGTRASYAKGKTAAGVVPWFAIPFTIGKNVNFGAAQYLDNLAYLNLSEIGAKAAAPKNVKILSAVETMLTNLGKSVREKPIAYGLVEAMAGTSQTILAGAAEQAYPNQFGPRIGAEAAGSLIPGVLGSLLIERTSGIVNALTGGFKNIKEKGFKGLNLIRNKREEAGIQKIISILEAEGEDIPAIIKKLSDPKLLTDAEGRPIDMTAGVKTGSAALMAIEAALSQSSRGLGKQQKTAVTQAGTAVRNLITALATSGDQTAFKEIARISESVFSASLADRLKTRTTQVLDAFKKARGDTPNSNSELGEALYRTITDLLVESRAQEKVLWRAIENQDITKFSRSDGTFSDVPNFIESWIKSMPEEEVAKEFYLKTGRLGPLNEFVEKMSLSLGIKRPPVKSNAKVLKLQEDLTKTDTPRDVEAYNALMNNMDDPDTIRTFNLGDRYLYEESLSPEDNLITLSQELLKKESGKFGSPLRKAELTKIIVRAKKKRELSSLMAKDSKNLVQDLTKAKTPVTVNSLVEMRSIALSIGAAQTAIGDRNSARLAFNFADALLKDINSIPPGQDLAYDAARAYSRSLNDVFQRAFAGDIIAKSKERSSRLAPELLSSAMLRGGAEPTNLRIKQISSVGDFAIKEGLPHAEDLSNTVSGTLEMILRNARSSTMDPVTGEVNTKLLTKWMDQNKELLDSQVFQGLRDDLLDVNKANVLLSDTRIKNKVLKKKLDDQFFFGKLLPKLDQGGAESPTLAAGSAVFGKTPTKDIFNLAKLAKSSSDPASALKGLKSAILESVMTKAGGTSQSFSVRSLADSLFTVMPKAKNRITLSEMLIKNDIMSEVEVKTMKSFITELAKYEAADASNTLGGLLEEGLNPMMDLYLALAGSQLGSTMGKFIPGRSGAGQGIIESGAGVKAMNRIFKDVPQSMKIDVMSELMQDPLRLGMMMARSKSEKIQLRIMERVNRFLMQQGFKPVRRTSSAVNRELEEALSLSDEDETQEVKERSDIQKIIDRNRLNNQQSSVQPGIAKGTPTARLSSNEPFLSGLNTAPAGGGISSATPANPNQRSQYASLFPNDIISGMIQPTATMAEGGAVPPREVDIKGQPHMLAYITPKEGGILQLMGGSGRPGPMGIPSFYSNDAQASTEGPGDGPSDSDFGGFSNYSPVDNNTISNQEDLGSGRYGVTQVAFSKGPKAGQTVSIYGRNSQKQTDSRRDAESIRDAMMNNNNPNVNKMNLFTVNKNPVTRGLQKTSIYGPKGPNVDTIQSLIDSINVQNARDAKDAAQQPSLMDSLMSGINIGNVNVSPGMVGTGYGVNFGTTFAKGGPVGIASLRRR